MNEQQQSTIASIFLRLWKKHQPVIVKLNAICDLCMKEAKGTKQELIDNGWSFGKGQTFCPRHD